MQHWDLHATIIHICPYETNYIEKLERLFSRFLADYAGTSMLIADIWCADDENDFPFSCMEHPVNWKNRRIGEIPVSLMEKLCANWFISRCTLFCVAGTVSTSLEYAEKARKLCPGKALRRRLIRAYVGGDDTEGYSIGVLGAHPEMLMQLKKALFE